MNFKYFLVVIAAFIIIISVREYTNHLVLIEAVNKETTAIHNDNKTKVNAKKGAVVLTEAASNIANDTIPYKAKDKKGWLKNIFNNKNK